MFTVHGHAYAPAGDAPDTINAEDLPAGGGAPEPEAKLDADGKPIEAAPEGTEGEGDVKPSAEDELVEARANRIAQERLDKIEADRQAQADADEAAKVFSDTDAAANGRIVKAGAAIAENFRNLTVNVNGAPTVITLSNEDIDKYVFSHLNEALADVRGTFGSEAGNRTTAAMLAALPEEVRKTVAPKLAGKDAKEQLGIFAEAFAPNTKWARDAGLEMAEMKARVKQADDVIAKNKPGGQPSGQVNPTGGAKLTAAMFTAMTPDQRVQAWRERPDEVRAL